MFDFLKWNFGKTLPFCRTGEKHENFYQNPNDHFVCETELLQKRTHFDFKLVLSYRLTNRLSLMPKIAKFVPWK